MIWRQAMTRQAVVLAAGVLAMSWLAVGVAVGAEPWVAPHPTPVAVPSAKMPFEPEGRPLAGLVTTHR